MKHFRRAPSYFHATWGRPSIPIETYLRLMFLKHRYQMGFEPLCREVADSISWQRFCRIPLGTSAPHPTTLMKITTRCGSEAVNGLNDALLTKAAAAKVLKTNRLRADTTVVEANVSYPTDSGLLAKGVTRMAKMIKGLKAQGLAVRTVTRDRTRTVSSRTRDISANLKKRTGEAKDAVRAINTELAGVAQRAITEAKAVARNASRKLGKTGSAGLRARVRKLQILADRVQIVADQTRMRMAGTMPDGASRLVSLHDPDARPIRKGRLGKPVEFATKPRWWTTRTGWCSITTWRSAIHPTHRCCYPLSGASVNDPARFPERLPPTGATLSRGWRMVSNSLE